MKNVLTLLILLSFITTTAEVKNQFATLPDIYSVKISPDGKSVGILRKIDGERMLSILDLDTKEVIYNHENYNAHIDKEVEVKILNEYLASYPEYKLD